MEHVSLDAQALAECTQDIREKLQTALAMVENVEPFTSTKSDFSPDRQLRVRNFVRLRRVRERFFDEGLFADPAWDILLELYAAELGSQRVTISSLCVASAVPPTTALRWINSLVEKGLLIRTNDHMDGRRVFASLSPSAFDAMERYFLSISETF